MALVRCWFGGLGFRPFAADGARDLQVLDTPSVVSICQVQTRPLEQLEFIVYQITKTFICHMSKDSCHRLVEVQVFCPSFYGRTTQRLEGVHP